MAKPTVPAKMFSRRSLADAFNALERLEFTSSKLQKEALLQKHANNSALKQILLMALGADTYFVHIDFDTSACANTLTASKSWTRFLRLATKLKTREVTGNAAKSKVLQLLVDSNPIVAKWLLRILDHNLRIGVSTHTMQAVYGHQVLADATTSGAARFKFRGCMLSLSRKKLPKRDAVFQYPLGGELKLDGERFLCFIFPQQQLAEIVSRRNKRYPHIEQCKPFIKQLLKVATFLGGGEPIFVDGEMLSKNWNSTSSVVSKTKNFKETEFLETTRAILWDWAPLSAYEGGTFLMPWLKRKRTLLGLSPEVDPQKILPKIYTISANVAVLGHKILKSEEQLTSFYGYAVNLGLEGIVSKILTGPAIFDNHRSKLAVKHKPEEPETGIIVGVRGGKGMHGPASATCLRKAKALLASYGHVKDDGHYLKLRLPDGAAQMVAHKLKEATGDGVARRVWIESQRVVSYRYGERLGYFIVRVGKTIFHVGTGIPHKNGRDLRTELWQRRKELKGMKLDFTYQKDSVEVAKKRFNRFSRVREDI